MKTVRRAFIRESLLAATGISVAFASLAKAQHIDTIFHPGNSSTSLENDAFKISIFSKTLQWLGYEEMARVAAEIGFDGIDLTVRPGGHVLPEKVHQDLPKAVASIRKEGLDVYMITTSIKDANDPLTENILKSASSLGIRHYRMGWFDYDEKKNIEENLMDFENHLTKLTSLNKKYKIYGEYQNHSGANFGSPIWDLYMVLKRLNSPWIGSQYDIFHATVEGAKSWPIGLKLLKPYVKSIDIKDFLWAKKDGKWSPEVVPLGKGLVDFENFLRLVKEHAINVPFSMHYEYSLGGAEHGAASITIKKEDVIAALKKDFDVLKSFFKLANLIK